MVGTARRLFDMTLAYAKERVQFDVPIGSFQAIQHKLADMALAFERATAAVHYAAMTRRRRRSRPRAGPCHVGQGRGRRGRPPDAAKDGIQIHGGIGYTWEHDLHLYLRRAYADEPSSAPPPGTTTASPTCSSTDDRRRWRGVGSR